jgi:hypothetical protein
VAFILVAVMAALSERWFNQWAFDFTEARVRPSDLAIVSTLWRLHQRRGSGDGHLRRSTANGFF